jgi:hypothetical protein
MMLGMTVGYYGEPIKKEGPPKKTLKDVQINPVIACVLCILFVLGSGIISLIMNDPDQGQLVTAEEMEKRIASEVVRIQKDQHMPPQAKAVALNALSRGRKWYIQPDQQIERKP